MLNNRATDIRSSKALNTEEKLEKVLPDEAQAAQTLTG